MFRAMKMAAVAASLILVAISGARAADTATVDDTARFLAGMMPSEGSPLLPLTKDASWQRHAKFFDNAFAQLEQRQLAKVRAWTDTNLAAPKPTMFYMFSGPDFLYANAFYGKATTYVMAALEPPGSLARSRQVATRHRQLGDGEYRTFALDHHELQLLHHQAHEDRSACRPDRRHAADPVRVHGAVGQIDQGGHPRHDRRERRGAYGRRGRQGQRAARREASCSPARMASRRRCIISRPIFPTAASSRAAS